MIAAIGGRTAATADITTAAVVEKSRMTFHARRMSSRQTPMTAKYQRFRVAWRSLNPRGTSVRRSGLSRCRTGTTVPAAARRQDASRQ